MRNRKIRKVFVDVGGLDGRTTFEFIDGHKNTYKDFEYYIIECSPIILKKLKDNIVNLGKSDVKFNIIEKAAWIYDGKIDFYVGRLCRCTLMKEYHKGGRDHLDKEHPIKVPCFDFGKWIKKAFKKCEIYIHMNIEGAEYDIIDQMIKDGTILLVKEMLFAKHARQVWLKSREKEKIILDYIEGNNLTNIYVNSQANREKFLKEKDV
jgi:FkbM family methyltransferase